jgi:2-keto-4-pentenoate hydratase
MLDSTKRATAAELLWAAERDLAPVDPLTETFPGIDVVDAYEIQLINIRRKLAAGARVRGHKVGLSSPVMQQMMGVDEPDYGHLLDSMVLSQETPIAAGRYCYPRIEVEIGYVLGAPLPGAGCTEEDVLAATEYIVPSLELIDSRITDWRIKLADTIADNASSAAMPAAPPPSWPSAASTSRTSTRCCTPATRRSPAATPVPSSATRPGAWPGWPGRWPHSG